MSDHAFAVLRQLSDGRFHSGEEMAKALGCSRTLVWQAVHAIESELGLTVFSVRGHGYRLRDPFAWMDMVQVRQHMNAAASEAFTLALVERTDSTNLQLIRRAAEGAPSGLVLAAEQQSAGRGRLGRRWQARLGTCLTFSLLWRFECGIGALAGLSLAVGIAIVRALRELQVPAVLKWPNDVLLDGRKLSGMLIELSGEAQGPAAVVIGIGINVTDPGPVDQPVATLADAGYGGGRNRLLGVALNHLQQVLACFDAQGFAGLRDEWMRYAAHRDTAVRLTFSHGEPVDGTMLGVDLSGALRLQTDGGERLFHAGEVSLRVRG